MRWQTPRREKARTEATKRGDWGPAFSTCDGAGLYSAGGRTDQVTGPYKRRVNGGRKEGI